MLLLVPPCRPGRPMFLRRMFVTLRDKGISPKPSKLPLV
jgi:hypothetical protein